MPSTRRPIKSQVPAQVFRAVQAEKYMLVCLRVEDGRVWCDAVMQNFPDADVDTACDLVTVAMDKHRSQVREKAEAEKAEMAKGKKMKGRKMTGN